MINNNKTAIITYIELYFNIKILKTKKEELFKIIQEVSYMEMEKIKKETLFIKEQYDLINKYFFITIDFKVTLHRISENFFEDIFTLNMINPEWYEEKTYEIKKDIYMAAGLYKIGIDLTNNSRYRNLKEVASLYLYRCAQQKYKKQEEGIRRSIEHTYFSIYLKKIREKEIIEILRELKTNTRKDNLEADILFEYLKRT